MDTEFSKALQILGGNTTLGGQTALAQALGVSNNAVSKWVANGRPPPGRVLQIFELVEGAPTPDGSLVDLRQLLKEASQHYYK